MKNLSVHLEQFLDGGKALPDHPPPPKVSLFIPSNGDGSYSCIQQVLRILVAPS